MGWNTGQLHFITFSCYRRLPFLEDPEPKNILETVIEKARQSHSLTIYAYVLMPEHVHLLTSEPETRTLSSFLRVLKAESSKLLKGSREKFWQTRYYDFNTFTTGKFVEKVQYIHRNPVTRGLVTRPEDYRWSSFNHYGGWPTHPKRPMMGAPFMRPHRMSGSFARRREPDKIPLMPPGLIRKQQTGQLHFITFSCYRRLPFLALTEPKNTLEQVIEKTRRTHSLTLYAYVLMPEHVHLLTNEPEVRTLASFLRVVKGESSKLLKGARKKFWQTRYYDFNTFTTGKFVEKVQYIHRNPVTRGLVARPEDYRWSSFNHYATGQSQTIQIDSQWTKTFRVPREIPFMR